jgi:hypothetical protein
MRLSQVRSEKTSFVWFVNPVHTYNGNGTDEKFSVIESPAPMEAKP